MHGKIEPILAIQYKRQHFLPKSSNFLCRITIDRDLNHWTFFQGKWTKLGTQKKINRIEIKMLSKEKKTRNQVLNLLIATIKKHSLLPAVEKPIITNTYRSDKFYREKSEKLILECDEDLKIKFNIEKEQPSVLFNKIKNLFSTNTKFYIHRRWPYTFEEGITNLYYPASGHHNEHRKLMFFSGKLVLVAKHNTSDPMVMSRRHKIKSYKLSKKNYLKLTKKTNPKGYILRTRKVFWLTSPTNRVYHVSVDRLAGRKLYHQLEIDYVGSREKTSHHIMITSDVIKEELAEIKNIITSKFNKYLITTTRKKMSMIKLLNN
jgi:hypothetical protein